MLSKSSNLYDPVSKLMFNHWVNFALARATDEQVNHYTELCADHMTVVPVHRLSNLEGCHCLCGVVGCEQVAVYQYEFNGVEQVEPEENA